MIIKLAGPYDALVNSAISGSKLSSATKLMGTSAQNAVKVLSATPTAVKSFSQFAKPVAKTVVKAFS